MSTRVTPVAPEAVVVIAVEDLDGGEGDVYIARRCGMGRVGAVTTAHLRVDGTDVPMAEVLRAVREAGLA